MPTDAPIALTQERMLELWYQALSAEIGITFTCSPKDMEKCKQKMYQVRRDIADSRLMDLSMHINEDGKTFLIYHKGSEEPLG